MIIQQFNYFLTFLIEVKNLLSIKFVLKYVLKNFKNFNYFFINLLIF